MRKHTITVYTNDEYGLYEILKEVRSEIDRKVFDRKDRKQRKFSGTWEVEKTIDSPTWRFMGHYETVAMWKSNVVSDDEFIKFQHDPFRNRGN